jgi:hypothetical protein
MNTKVEQANPITSNRYLNPSKDRKLKMILLGVSLPGKKALVGPSPAFFIKARTVKIADRLIKIMEARRGKRPPPGEWKDPMG